MQTQKEIILLIVATTFLLFILLSFIVTMLFLNKNQQNGFLKEVELIKSNFEKELLKTQLEIQEETFQHISLELHDNVGHFLSLAKLHLTTLRIPIHEELTKKMDAAALLIAYSLDEIRNISKSLNPENIKSNGLIKTVEQQIEQLQKSGQFTINFTLSGKTCYLEDQKEIVLFRILQESLNNIVRHSKANLIHIKLHYDEQKLLLSIHDNGIGFNIDHLYRNEKHNSSGLKNIIKRSSLLNATHEILSIPGEGTTIKIITPY
ncbi:MAG: ATP-binding protein [Chitinophagaceae bacterium]